MYPVHYIKCLVKKKCQCTGIVTANYTNSCFEKLAWDVSAKIKVLFAWPNTKLKVHEIKGFYSNFRTHKTLLLVGLKRVFGYSDSGRCQTSTRHCRPTQVLGIYNDGRKLCCKVACGDYFKAYLTSVVITVTMLYILTVLRA